MTGNADTSLPTLRVGSRGDVVTLEAVGPSGVLSFDIGEGGMVGVRDLALGVALLDAELKASPEGGRAWLIDPASFLLGLEGPGAAG